MLLLHKKIRKKNVSNDWGENVLKTCKSIAYAKMFYAFTFIPLMPSDFSRKSEKIQEKITDKR